MLKRIVVLLLAACVLVVVGAWAEDSEGLFKNGDYNGDVVALHEKLSELGYFYLRSESPWGFKSASALKTLQENMNWEVTGIVASQADLDMILAVENVIGRNLLLGTNQGTTNYRIVDKGFNATIEEDGIGVKITNATRDDDGWLVLFFDDGRSRELLSGPEGDIYTLSFEAKANTDNAKMAISHRRTNAKDNQITFGTVNLETRDVWQEVVLHGTLSEVEATLQGLYISLNSIPANTEICIRNVKLERGARATGWIPASEDIE